MSTAHELIRRMPAAFRPQAAGDLQMTVEYAVAEPMHVVIDRGLCTVHDGAAADPDVRLIVRDDHLVKLMTGRMRGLTAFLTGRLRVEGNYILAQKLQSIFDRDRLVA